MRDTQTDKKNRKKFPREIIVGFLLVLSVFLIFSPVIHHDFVGYDDSEYVGDETPHVREGLTWKGMVWAFTTNHADFWHPLTWLSIMLDWQLYGNNAGGHHLTSLIFHILNSLLLLLWLNRATQSLWRSAFVAALFALHPLHVESVAWVAERKDVLSTFFWMLTLLAYTSYVRSSSDSGKRRFWKYGLTLLTLALGLMAKPMLVTMPFVFLLLDFWPLGRVSFQNKIHLEREKLRQVFLEKIPFFFVVAAASVTTLLLRKHAGTVSTAIDFPIILERLSNAAVFYLRYVEKMFWPKNLSVLYPIEKPLTGEIVAAILFLAATIALVVWQRRARPYLAVGWFWFLGTLVPVIGLVEVGAQPFADRFTYIPLIGLFFAITWTAADLLLRRNFHPAMRGVCAGLVLLCCVGLTKKQVGVWKNTATLFYHAIKVTEKNYKAYNIIALSLCDQDRYAEAIGLIQKSLEIQPTYADAHNNLGYALAQIGKHEEAIEHLRIALTINPAYVDAHNNLGISLAAIGKVDEAIPHYEIALANNPKYADAHNNLGIALVTRGDFASAIEHFRAACKFKPDYLAALNGLAWLLATHPNPKFRDGSEAVRLASHAVKLTNGKDAGVLETLAAAYAESGDFTNALKSAQSALGNADDEEMKTRLTSQIQMYGANQPYRDASFR